MTINPKVEFFRRLEEQWLPAFCEDAERQLSRAGFRCNPAKLSSEDASDFMRAVDSGVVIDRRGGRYEAERSGPHEQLFWEGLRSKSPRPLFLWLEPIITIGAAGRLHLDYGWPKNLIGTQSKTWEFDLVVYVPGRSDYEYLVGEVKKSTKELDFLLTKMHSFCRDEVVDEKRLSAPEKNAYRKWLALRQSSAEMFWAVGPRRHSLLFNVKRLPGGSYWLEEVPIEMLHMRVDVGNPPTTSIGADG